MTNEQKYIRLLEARVAFERALTDAVLILEADFDDAHQGLQVCALAGIATIELGRGMRSLGDFMAELVKVGRVRGAEVAAAQQKACDEIMDIAKATNERSALVRAAALGLS